MHRLTNTTIWASPLVTCLCLALVATGCGGKKGPDDPTTKNAAEASEESEGEHGGGEHDDAGAPEKKDLCVGFDIGNLEDLLAKSDCEVPDARPETVPNADTKGKLEITLGASPTKVATGGKADLVVTFANKTSEPMSLSFRIDPLARFETETYDAKGKRADMPPGKPPPPPKGHSAPPPAEPKVAKVTVAANGSARVRVPWEAVKMKWAPNKVRGTAVEKGYPRVPAGPLPEGKYTVTVVTPLIGVMEGVDHEVSAPKVDIEVGL